MLIRFLFLATYSLSYLQQMSKLNHAHTAWRSSLRFSVLHYIPATLSHNQWPTSHTNSKEMRYLLHNLVDFWVDCYCYATGCQCASEWWTWDWRPAFQNSHQCSFSSKLTFSPWTCLAMITRGYINKTSDVTTHWAFQMVWNEWEVNVGTPSPKYLLLQSNLN